MARLYIDTSSLVKLYRTEPDSAAVQAVIGSNDELVISDLARLEFRSAFARLERQSLIASADDANFVSGLNSAIGQCTVIALTSAIAGFAESPIVIHGVSGGLRRLDALQLTCALEAHAVQSINGFVSSDRALRAIAAAEGLTVLPP
jgi:predicted nucleic acid-binding protein